MKHKLNKSLFLLVAVIALGACQKDGPSSSSSSTVQLIPTINKTPIVDAGADQTILLPVDSTSLSGSGTDADGSIVSFAWSKISGPSTFSIIDQNTSTTKISDLVQGTYAFELTATDNGGATANDRVMITVNAAFNLPPVANAGVDQVILLPTNNFTLSGSGIDPDGTIVSYQWTITAYFSQIGQYGGFDYSTQTATLNQVAEGMYWCTLKVTDDQGLWDTDDIIVRVVSANCPCYPDPCDAWGDPCNPWDY